MSLTLVEDDSAALAGRVRSGAADLALIGAAGRLPADVAALPVVTERLAVAAPPGHPLLAGRAPVPLNCLAGYQVVCLPVGTGIRAALDEACAAQGLTLDVTLEASAPAAVAGPGRSRPRRRGPVRVDGRRPRRPWTACPSTARA